MYIYSLKYHTIVTIYEKYIPQLGAKIKKENRRLGWRVRLRDFDHTILN